MIAAVIQCIPPSDRPICVTVVGPDENPARERSSRIFSSRQSDIGTIIHLLKDDSMTKSYLRLQPSEGFVIDAAAQIFAAQIIAGKLTDSNRDELLKQSIRDAIRISLAVDDAIVSDGETA